MAQQQLTKKMEDQEQLFASQLRALKQTLPDLVEDPPSIAEPSVQKPFTLPARQRMDPLELMQDQIGCAKVALKERRAAKRANKVTMKKTIKQVGKKYFSYTANNKETYVMNNGNPLRCTMTCYDSLAVFNVPLEDRKAINTKIKEMANSSHMKGNVQLMEEQGEKTVFLKIDKFSKLFDAEKKPLATLPKTPMDCKICMRFIGVIKCENNDIRPMMRLHQVKVESNAMNEDDEEMDQPCMFN